MEKTSHKLSRIQIDHRTVKKIAINLNVPTVDAVPGSLQILQRSQIGYCRICNFLNLGNLRHHTNAKEGSLTLQGVLDYFDPKRILAAKEVTGAQSGAQLRFHRTNVAFAVDKISDCRLGNAEFRFIGIRHTALILSVLRFTVKKVLGLTSCLTAYVYTANTPATNL